jgi:acyl-CoA synthetase (NDP forming)
LADDEETGVVGIFAEGIREGRRFVDAARKVTARKPVVVLKAGKGAAGARAASSHTGSLAGAHAAAQAAFDRAGVIEAVDSDAFFDALAALATLPVGRIGRRIAVLTISGGPGVLAADAAERLGLQLPAPGSGTVERLRVLVPSFAALGNPIDLTPQCPPDVYGPAVAAVFDDPGFDAVVVIDCGLDVAELGQAVVTAAGRTGKPVTAFVLDVPGIEAALDTARIPRFASPERAVAGVRHAAV